MPSPFIGGRIPQDLHDALQNHIAESGEKLPQILQKALSSYLNYAPAIDQRKAGLEERVTSLETSIRDLREAFERIQQTPSLTNIASGEAAPPGQLSFLDIDNNPDIAAVIKEEKPDNSSDIRIDNSSVETDINTDSKNDNNGHELTHEQVSQILKKSLGAMRSYHQRKRTLENGLYKYIPSGERGHPKWIVEKR